MRKNIKRITAYISALAVAAGLAACGGSGEADGTDKAEAVQTPEYVYTSEFTSILKDDKKGIEPLLMTDNGLYAAYAEKVGENIPEGVTPEYEGQYDINEIRLEYIGFDGSVTKLEEYAPLKPDLDGEGKRDYVSSSTPQGAANSSEGELLLLESVYTSYSEAPEEIKAENAEYFNYERTQTDYYLRTLNENGAEINRVKLDIGADETVQSMKSDADGDIYILLDTSVAVYSADGEKKFDVTADGDYIYSICTLSSGDIGALMYKNNLGMCLYRIDAAARALSSDYVVISKYAYEAIDGSGTYEFYYNGGSGFYGYNAETGEAEKLFTWTDCDVNGDNTYSISVSTDGVVRGISMEYDSKRGSYSYELAAISKAPYSSVPQKEHLTLATTYASPETENAVIKFNRASDKYHVDIIDYSEQTESGSLSDALTKLNTEIMAGNMPDMLDLSDLPYTQLAAKGLLEDLYPYIDADSKINREDFFGNILSAYEIDGGLYAAPAGFGVMTVEGASSVVGDTPGWTYDDYYAALAAMPEGCEGFDYACTQNSMLDLGVAIDFDSFVNWSTGECNFNSEVFIRLLEYAKTFTPDAELENYEASETDSAAYRISQGQQMLNIVSFGTFNDYGEDIFKTDTTYIGFPNLSGEPGEVFQAYECYAMSSACKNKEAAWEFLRSFLSEEYQLSGSYFPTNKKAFDELLADAQVIEYETDANGNYKLDANGERIREVIGIMYDGVSYYNIYSGITAERAAAIEELANRVTKRVNYDTSILDIVEEQAAAYFAGDKTAEETAKLVQSKASIYVSEQK